MVCTGHELRVDNVTGSPSTVVHLWLEWVRDQHASDVTWQYSPQGLGADQRRLEAQEAIGAAFLVGARVRANLGATVIAVLLVPLPLPLVPPVTDEERHAQSHQRGQGGQDGR